MPSLKEKSIALLGSLVFHCQTVDGAQTIFTVPIDKVARIIAVVVRDPTGSFAGGTDFDFTNWRQTVDLSAMTGGATNYRVLLAGDNTSYVEIGAGVAFQCTPSTGATADIDCTLDVFGYLT